MKIITQNNIVDFYLGDLRKVAAVFTPVRETVDYKGADYIVRVNNLSNVDQSEILSINITNPQLFYFMYLTTLNTIKSAIEENFIGISEHFGKPQEIEIEAKGLRLVISTPTGNVEDSKVLRAYVVDLEEVLANIHPADFYNIKKKAVDKAKQYFEKQQ